MSVPAVTAPFLASTVLLGLAGAAKAMNPDYTARALHVAGIKAGRWAVRAGAAAEIAVAVAALAVPNPITGALVGASYLAFAIFVGIALRKGWPLSTCGCFGRRDSVPSRSHLALDIGAVLSAAIWVCGRPRGLSSALSGQPWTGWALLIISALVALMAYIVWTNPLAEARRQ
ncbi:MAG TPA: MauE/DoxX family redox-associated membrane protein [Acidimicrobiales bacterium]|nr:MauE/DoxX family redox-associated membrane protein [Acidimicrobiales bacterium]